MRTRLGTIALGLALLAAALLAPSASADDTPWLRQARILVHADLANQDCRTGVCRHNENTDLVRWKGAIYFVHRTAGSQVLGPNSSLRVYRSTRRRPDVQAARDHPGAGRPRYSRPGLLQGRRPALHQGDHAAARLRSARRRRRLDLGRDPLARRPRLVGHASAIGPQGWGFWRVVAAGRHVLLRGLRGRRPARRALPLHRRAQWTAGPQIYGVSEDTPLETELDVHALRQADAGARAHGRQQQRAVRLSGPPADQGVLGDAALTAASTARRSSTAFASTARSRSLGRAPVRDRAQAPAGREICASAPRSTSSRATSSAGRSRSTSGASSPAPATPPTPGSPASTARAS